MKKFYYSYDQFRNDTNTLLQRLKCDHFDTVIGIARGGLILAQAISEALEIRNVQTIQTQLYDGEKKRECITIVGKCSLETSKKVLVVDDIADSGETLQKVMRHLIKNHTDTTFKSATLFYKTSSLIEPDFWINETNDWIDFFWEIDFK